MHGTRAALVLAGYYNNVHSNRDTAYLYVLKGLEIDSTNAQLKSIKQMFDTQKPAKSPGTPSKGNNKPTSFIRKHEATAGKQI